MHKTVLLSSKVSRNAINHIPLTVKFYSKFNNLSPLHWPLSQPISACGDTSVQFGQIIISNLTPCLLNCFIKVLYGVGLLTTGIYTILSIKPHTFSIIFKSGDRAGYGKVQTHAVTSIDEYNERHGMMRFPVDNSKSVVLLIGRQSMETNRSKAFGNSIQNFGCFEPLSTATHRRHKFISNI